MSSTDAITELYNSTSPHAVWHTVHDVGLEQKREFGRYVLESDDSDPSPFVSTSYYSTTDCRSYARNEMNFCAGLGDSRSEHPSLC